jgi:CRP-like cAMP-binding protein
VKVDLPIGREIEFPDNEIRHLFFLEAGVASMTNTFADGGQVEVAVYGFEAVLGTSYLMGTRRSLNRVYMQIAGYGYSTKSASAVQEFELHSEFRGLVLRSVQDQFIQTSQTAGCNARHQVQQRLARWLLLCHDRVENGPINLSQEFIAQMLGNQRTSVSLEAGRLQKEGLIQYTRGAILVLDRAGLEQKACECYAKVRNAYLPNTHAGKIDRADYAVSPVGHHLNEAHE